MRQGLRPVPTFRDRGDCAMACAVIRSLEKKLVSDERLEELIEARDTKEMAALLARWGWVPRELHGQDATFDEMLRASQVGVSRRLLALAGPSPAAKILFMRFEMQNLAAAARGRTSGRAAAPRHPGGISSASALEMMAAREDFGDYPEALAAALESVLLPGKNGRGAGDALLAAWHEALLAAVGAEKSELPRDYLRHRADLMNIGSRVRAMRFPSARGDAPMLAGGMIDTDRLREAGNSGALGRLLGKTVYDGLFAASRDNDGNVHLRRLARLSDDFLTAVMQPAKHVALGPEPIWGYHHARRVDELNIRAIAMTARGAGGAGLSGRKLRKPYV
jgi:hypothetical protein